MENNVISVAAKGMLLEVKISGTSDLTPFLFAVVVEYSRDRPEDLYPFLGTFSDAFRGEIALLRTLLLFTSLSFDIHYHLVVFSLIVITELGASSLDKDVRFLHISDADLFYFQELLRLQKADLLMLHSARHLSGSFIGFSSFEIKDSRNRKTYKDWVSFIISDSMTFVFSTCAESSQCCLILVHSQLRPEDHISILKNMKLRLKDSSIGSWIHFQLTSPFWICSSLPEPKIHSLCRLPKAILGLKSDELFISFKERAFSSISSLWERSFSPPSSTMERILSSPPFVSFMEEHIETRSQTMPLFVDKSLASLVTCFLSNSIERFEPILWSDSLTDVMLSYSDKAHVDLYGILQNCLVLEKCVISIYLLCFYIFISWMVCIREIEFVTPIYCCISEI